MKRSFAVITALAALATLSACDRPKPRTPPPAQALPPAAVERAGPARWNAEAARFEVGGKPVQAAKVWTFPNSVEGWTLNNGEIGVAPGGGLTLRNIAPDPMLISPADLAVEGRSNPLVLVRLTRTRPGKLWSGVLFYATPKHSYAEQFRGKLVDGRDIAVNETATLVFDMANPAKGGDDWINSTIDQIRFDTDDEAGGAFIVHQIAIGPNPDPAALAPQG